MKIVGVLALGPREKAVLLQVQDQILLLGVTAQEVRLLTRVNKGSEELKKHGSEE
jgi:flagellar biogenesis protein FliO